MDKEELKRLIELTKSKITINNSEENNSSNNNENKLEIVDDIISLEENSYTLINKEKILYNNGILYFKFNHNPFTTEQKDKITELIKNNLLVVKNDEIKKVRKTNDKIDGIYDFDVSNSLLKFVFTNINYKLYRNSKSIGLDISNLIHNDNTLLDIINVILDWFVEIGLSKNINFKQIINNRQILFCQLRVGNKSNYLSTELKLLNGVQINKFDEIPFSGVGNFVVEFKSLTVYDLSAKPKLSIESGIINSQSKMNDFSLNLFK